MNDSAEGYRVMLFDVAGEDPPRSLGRSFPQPALLTFGPDSRSIGWGGDLSRNEPAAKIKLSAGLDLHALEPLKHEQVEGFDTKPWIPEGWTFKNEAIKGDPFNAAPSSFTATAPGRRFTRVMAWGSARSRSTRTRRRRSGWPP